MSKLRSRGDSAMVRARLAAQKGFTLVEMAIVLVIIGLIVGGILKGQEIVNNGRVKTQVAQIDAIKASIQTFQDKYGAYPGDGNTMSTQLGIDATFNGNNDGVISTSVAVPPVPDADTAAEPVSKEPNAVWYELQVANLLSGVEYTAAGTAVTNALSFNYGGKIAGSFLEYADFTVTLGGGSIISNKIVRISGVANPTIPTPVMREQDAAQIDLKYDDGLPNTGSIVAARYSTVNCCKGVSCQTAITTNYGLTTTASASGNYCALLWATQ